MFNKKKQHYKKKAEGLQKEIWDLEFEKMILAGAVSGTNIEIQQFTDQVVANNSEIQKEKEKERMDIDRVKKINKMNLDIKEIIKKKEYVSKGFQEQLKKIEFRIRATQARKSILEEVINGKRKIK